MTTTINNEHKKLNVPKSQISGVSGSETNYIQKCYNIAREVVPHVLSSEYVYNNQIAKMVLAELDKNRRYMPHFRRIVTSTRGKITKSNIRCSYKHMTKQICLLAI